MAEVSISFGGIPNSRNGLFLQIFLKRAAKQSAGNTSAGFPWLKWPQILLNPTWLCTKASGIFSGTLLNLTWIWIKVLQTFSGTFSGTLWTWPSSAPKPPRPSPEPSPEPDPALCTEASHTFSGTFSGTLLNLTWLCTPELAMHQSLREPSVEPSSQPCWTWRGFAPKPSLQPSWEPGWTWLTRASQTFSGPFSGTLLNSPSFSGTFSGTLLNRTRLCTEAFPQWLG